MLILRYACSITCRGGKNREIFIFDDEERVCVLLAIVDNNAHPLSQAGFIVVKASNDNVGHELTAV
jgi:hypothetical protein